jgi:hypothetical protein
MAKPNIDSQKPINEDTTMTIIKAAAVQLSPVLYSRDGLPTRLPKSHVHERSAHLMSVAVDEADRPGESK